MQKAFIISMNSENWLSCGREGARNVSVQWLVLRLDPIIIEGLQSEKSRIAEAYIQ